MLILDISSAVLLSDQGTDVREITTGNLTNSGNLTIEIYDSSASGTLIFNQNFSNIIANGSWNVMISPSLEYGKSYWKDYKINNEDLDFDGNERLEFQSPLGLINNISFINFSLINSCSAGNSIRLIYGNGSVECEADDNSGTTNLTNYALKNQSETFEGNITTSQTGFFGWLGSLTSRITKIFAQDIDVSNNLNVSKNVTALYFIGDGSLLTNLATSNNSWNETRAGLLYSPVSWSYNQTNDTFTLYNSTWDNRLLIIQSNASMKNYVDAQILTVSSNYSWNETRAGLLYSPISWSYNQTNDTFTLYNATWDNRLLIIQSNASMKNYVDAQILTVTSNYSWNESRAGLLYSPISWSYNQANDTFTLYNATWDNRLLIIQSNASMKNYVDAQILTVTSNFSWNETRAGLLYSPISWNYNQTNDTFTLWNSTWDNRLLIIQSNASMKNYVDAQILTVTSNYSWNETRAGLLYILGNNGTIVGLINNASYLSTYNATYAAWSYNQTTGTFNLYNATWDNRFLIQNLNQTITDNNLSWLSTYNASYDSRLGSAWSRNNTAIWNSTALYFGIGLASASSALNVSGSIGATGSINTSNDVCISGLNCLRNISNSLDTRDFLSTYNATYESWNYNQTTAGDIRFVNLDGDNMTGILNMTAKNITTVDCIFFKTGGKICSA